MTEPFTLHVDHHERMIAGGHRDDDARRRAELVRVRSRDDLWAPYRDSSVLTAHEIDRILTERSRPARRPDGATRTDAAFLDQWLERRRAAAADAAATVPRTGTGTPMIPDEAAGT